MYKLLHARHSLSSLELFVAFPAFLASAGFCFLGGGGGAVFVLNGWLLLQSEESLSDLMFLVPTWSESQISNWEQFTSETGKVCMILKMSVSN